MCGRRRRRDTKGSVEPTFETSRVREMHSQVTGVTGQRHRGNPIYREDVLGSGKSQNGGGSARREKQKKWFPTPGRQNLRTQIKPRKNTRKRSRVFERGGGKTGGGRTEYAFALKKQGKLSTPKKVGKEKKKGKKIIGRGKDGLGVMEGRENRTKQVWKGAKVVHGVGAT